MQWPLEDGIGQASGIVDVPIYEIQHPERVEDTADEPPSPGTNPEMIADLWGGFF